MGLKFWFVRAVKIYLLVFALLLVIEVLKHHLVGSAILFAAVWSGVATTVFIGSRLYQSSKKIHCQLCDDIPIDNEE